MNYNLKKLLIKYILVYNVSRPSAKIVKMLCACVWYKIGRRKYGNVVKLQAKDHTST
jgi:hypothetical protein